MKTRLTIGLYLAYLRLKSTTQEAFLHVMDSKGDLAAALVAKNEALDAFARANGFDDDCHLNEARERFFHDRIAPSVGTHSGATSKVKRRFSIGLYETWSLMTATSKHFVATDGGSVMDTIARQAGYADADAFAAAAERFRVRVILPSLARVVHPEVGLCGDRPLDHREVRHA